MYRHIITLECLAAPPFKRIVAIVNNEAVSSYTNIERCGFARLEDAPDDLSSREAEYGLAPDTQWSKAAVSTHPPKGSRMPTILSRLGGQSIV